MFRTCRANRDRNMYTPRFSPCDFSVMPFLRVGLKLDRILDMDLDMLDSQLVSSYWTRTLLGH